LTFDLRPSSFLSSFFSSSSATLGFVRDEEPPAAQSTRSFAPMISTGRVFVGVRHLPARSAADGRSKRILAAMFSWLRSRLFHRHAPETSRLIVGSTGSGKSEGELADLIRLARRGDHAVVVLDGHGPLSFAAAGHWAARGFEPRLVYEPLHDTDRVLCWHMLPQSAASTLSQRLLADAETREEVAQCFLAQRNLATLNDRPWTKEWLEAAIDLCLAQPDPQSLPTLLAAFRTGTAEYRRLLKHCAREDVADKFRDLEIIRRKNPVQYEQLTGASRRLLELVCTSEIVRLRSRPGPFDWLTALREQRLIAFDGGGIRSREIKRTLFLLVSMQVIHAVRRHFAETQDPLRVVLVLEEAGALGLVTPFVMGALQELRKAGLSIHLITQSSLDFGDAAVFQAVLADTPWQAWYQSLSPADQELGARALANATFDPLAVHYVRNRTVPAGARRVEHASHGKSLDAHHRLLQRDHRTSTAHVTTYRSIAERAYKSPQLHEQEYRTRLATLRVGERLVRDRHHVWRERLGRVRSPWWMSVTDDFTRCVIDRVRRQPIYLPCPEEDPLPVEENLTDAAARLRMQFPADGSDDDTR
jgi:hypothetical protein